MSSENRKNKPDYLTCLRGDILVSKSHERIRFRGCIDSLEADVLEAQALAAEKGETALCTDLEDALHCLREIMKAEVTGRPLAPPRFFGFSADELHARTHDVKGAFGFDHPVPAHTMGAAALRLNTLRARIREAEVLAAGIFSPVNAAGVPAENREVREDILYALNRLSSAVYWLFCRCVRAENSI
jgi:ethanolamine utilization cobalamin adenosyltransferase